MNGWFNAKELKAALEWAIEWAAVHGDENAYVCPFHEENGTDRVRVLVGFDDGETEMTGASWKREEPTHFPYSKFA